MAQRVRSQSIEELQALTATLQSELATQAQELARRDALIKEQSARIEKLGFEIARLKRWRFGKSAETLSADQLALWESELDEDIAQLEAQLEDLSKDEDTTGKKPPKQQPKRQRLPDSLPRLEVRHDLDSHACPGCGQDLERIGEEISEQLDVIPARFFVRRHIRPKYCCRHCESVHAAPMPAQPIDKGLPAPGLLSHVAIAKFLDHQPLYRQESQCARMGVALSRSTMAGWLGQVQVLIEPLVECLSEHLRRQIMLHADETPVPVLDPGSGRTATGYLWAYRTGAWSALQAVAYDFAMSRGRDVPSRFLAPFRGTLLVDGYAGYGEVLKRPGMTEAGCWAHVRRQFFEVFEATKSPVAQTALVEIGKLYDIERDLKERPPDGRLGARQQRAGPILAAFKVWLDKTYGKSPPRSALAKAMLYTINRWKALSAYLADGMLGIDNNPVENAIRGIALGRKNWLFAGSELGGQRAARFYTLIETAKLNGVDPHAYLTHIFERLPSAKLADLDALLPWNFAPQPPADIVVG
jgi:transposase